ncbi:MAG: DMT family transporter [Eubacterium sp.]|nr:DMT family transporter [Eubacterium sp.]
MSKHTIGHLTALFTILIWGTTFISTKVLLKSFAPMEILFLRFTLGLAALFVVHPHLLRLRDRRQEITFALAGLCGVCLYYLLENIALTYTLAANVGIITSTAPLFTFLVTHFVTREEGFHAGFFIGFVCAIAGIVLIGQNGLRFSVNPLGDVLALLASMVWAFYAVLSKKIGGYGYNVIQSTRRIFIYGLIFMLPALMISGVHFSPGNIIQPTNAANLVFLGLGASAACFVTWNFSVKVLGAVKTSVYIYLVPVITLTASALILKEPITLQSLCGAALILLGLILSERPLPRELKPQK